MGKISEEERLLHVLFPVRTILRSVFVSGKQRTLHFIGKLYDVCDLARQEQAPCACG